MVSLCIHGDVSSNLIFFFVLFVYFTYLFLKIIRYGKFMEYAYFDDAIRLVKFDYDTTANNVVIEVPHFWNYAGIRTSLSLSLPFSTCPPPPFYLYPRRERSRLQIHYLFVLPAFDPDFQVLLDNGKVTKSCDGKIIDKNGGVCILPLSAPSPVSPLCITLHHKYI